MNKKEIEKITKAVEKEFPEDTALQQVHIARKILAKEVEAAGLSFIEYITSLEKSRIAAR